MSEPKSEAFVCFNFQYIVLKVLLLLVLLQPVCGYVMTLLAALKQ